MSTWPIHPLRGGVHPAEQKALSNQTPIQSAPLAQQLIVPLLQHLGSAAEACVQVGDYVLKGQLIADSNSFISAPACAQLRHSQLYWSTALPPCIGAAA